MSVVGFDFGNQNAYIAVARGGGIDVLINDYSLHATPTCVAFGQQSRSLGVAARNQVSTNFKNTIMNFKHLLGRKFDDPVAQRFAQFIPSPMKRGPNGEICFEVNYLGEQKVLNVEQITGALLVKLKQITEAQIGSRVSDVVVSVPSYFADEQRQALLEAGHIAGINVLKIVNENMAVGIAYGIYKKGMLPSAEEKPKLVAFIDIGHSCVTASLLEFQERLVRVRDSTFDLGVGGLFFDEIIREHFRQEFIDKYKIDPKTNPRAWLRLLDESEKLKKQMSANSTNIPLNIECFMNDVDVSAKMNRAEFEQKAEHLFQRIRTLLLDLFQKSGVKPQDVAEVEIIGGSSRIPFIKQIIAHIFNREPKTTLNADDVVARGAAMQCAILSPTIKVLEFNVINSQNYSIGVNYISSENQDVTQTVFKQNDEFPYNRLLPLHKTEPFTISAFYENMHGIPHPQQQLGTWRINGVTKPHDADFRVVRVKLALDQNGIFSVRKAMYEEKVVEEEPEQEQAAPEQTEQQPAGEGEKEQKSPEKEEKKAPPKPKKRVVELPIEKTHGRLVDLTPLIEFEKRMQEVDLSHKLTADAKNAVEEYVYSMRDKLCEQLAEFVTDEESDQFRSLLTATEDWLYGEGEEADRATYDQKLAEIRNVIEPPIHRRQREKADREEIERNIAAEQLKQEQEKNGPVVEEPMES